jgi:recombination protein RecA
MARKKITNDDDLFAELANETGGDLLSDREQVSYYLDTGSLAVNYIMSGKFIGGGLAGGRIIEVYGPSSSGKSFLAANAFFGCQKHNGICAILDCENATNGEFMAKTSHLNLKRVIRYTPQSLEAAFRKIHTGIKIFRDKVSDLNRPILFVYDSISVSPCERELKENNLPENYKASDWKKLVGRKEQPGERARVCGNELRKVQSVLEATNTTLLVINQTRDKIGVLWGDPETTGGGGRALPFYAAQRCRTSTKKKIENKKLGTFAGVNMKVQNKKNRLFRPFVESEGIQLYFESGINAISGLFTLLIQAERIEPRKVEGEKGHSYFVKDDYLPEGVTEYKVKINKDRNEVPLKALMDCPKLVDAETREDLEQYLNPFMTSIASSSSEDFNEKEISFDEEGNPLDADDDVASEMEEMDGEEVVE